MTRQDAVSKWCPFARAPFGRPAVNREADGDVHFAAMCVADRCMAWRRYEDQPASGWCGMAGHTGAL